MAKGYGETKTLDEADRAGLCPRCGANRPGGVEVDVGVVVGARLGRPDQPHQHPQGRRLTGAVWTDEPVDRSGRHREREIGDGRDIVGRQAIDHRVGRRDDRQ